MAGLLPKVDGQDPRREIVEYGRFLGEVVGADFTPVPPPQIPEPGTLLLLGSGLLGLALVDSRKKFRK